jgi:maltose alpha-D-glucosyltransferase/alpha-amylase
MGAPSKNRDGLDPDPYWYKSGVIYEVHVRAFLDSDGDGTGDLRGLTRKLEYIRDLGVTAIWLLPFYPSPLKDDGYDIADYYGVHPSYGTLRDFKTFLREAHRHGLRVITELVLNHTSDQHPWFTRARHAKPGSRWRNFYVWSQTGKEYPDARILFEDLEISNWTYDQEARAYYWHRFFSHQPDLNYENPEVHKAMIEVVDFWLGMGVDGMRLDAVPYLYERDGTSCENLPETHAFLKKLRQHVDENFPDRMLLGEANQWPEDAVSYFGQGRGDECHMAFHFPLMPRLFMAVRMEDRQPIVDILEQTPPIPETSQWALFLRNHDELTLETVTDEERDYMYRMYAHVPQARLNLGIRRRLAPLLNNDRKRIELLNALLFSLPGTPVLYYGDEIGLGENIFLGDRNGVRTPMQWSSDKNAGFSRANPQSLYLPVILDPGYHYEANNVEVQLSNPHSLLWWMRRLLALRKRWRALGEGKCEFLQPENRKVLVYLLRFQKETLLVVANLSRFTQPVELDLSALKGMVPIELFGRSGFPEITERPYFLSLAPHSFFWFSLEPRSAGAPVPGGATTPALIRSISVSHHWREVFAERNRFGLRELLPDYLKLQSWFRGKSKTIKLLAIKEFVPVTLEGGQEAVLLLLQVDYVEGDSEMYALPLAFAEGTDADKLRQQSPARIISELLLTEPARKGILYDAFDSSHFCTAMLEWIWHKRGLKGAAGKIEALRMPALRALLGDDELPTPIASRHEQNNSSVIYGDKLILKLFRRLESGLNPEFEMTRFLNSRGFAYCPKVGGALDYDGPGSARITLAVVSSFVPSAKTAWQYTMDALGRFYERVITGAAEAAPAPAAGSDPLSLITQDSPSPVETVGTYIEFSRLLGARTAELHIALASDSDDPDFAPELQTTHHRRGLFQSMRSSATHTLRQLRRQLKNLPQQIQPSAQHTLDLEQAIVQSYRALGDIDAHSSRIRIHGDCRLHQVLWTGKDFVFIDFEGDSEVLISERRIKRSPLRDVAAMLRSIHYAARAGIDQHVERGSLPDENRSRADSWLRHWIISVSAEYLKSYFQTMSGNGILPDDAKDRQVMVRAYLLNQMVIEINRALPARSASLEIPFAGVRFLLG